MRSSVELPKFIRTPLRSFSDLVDGNIIAVYDIGNDKVLMLTDVAFILFAPEEETDEFGRTTGVHHNIITEPDDVRYAVGLDKCLEYGLIDGIAYKSWKKIMEDEEEERLQRSLDTDYRKYQALQKAFEKIWDKQDGKWVRRNK